MRYIYEFIALVNQQRFELSSKGRIYSACVSSVIDVRCYSMLYRSETWPAKGDDIIRLYINGGKRARWISNVRLG